MTSLAAALALLAVAGGASAEEWRYDCRRVFPTYTPGPANGTCELVHDRETGYARIYLPEPGLEALVAGAVFLALLARLRAS